MSKTRKAATHAAEINESKRKVIIIDAIIDVGTGESIIPCDDELEKYVELIGKNGKTVEPGPFGPDSCVVRDRKAGLDVYYTVQVSAA